MEKLKKWHFVYFITLATFHFQSASAVVLPAPTGKYAVGTQALELQDPGREPFHGTGPRRWMTQVFYPTDEAAYLSAHVTFPYLPGTLPDGKILDIEVYAHSKPSAIISKQGLFPVVFFIPGYGNNRQNYTILCEELASHGYVVLSLDQPYVSNFVRFLDGSVIVPTAYDIWKTPRDRDYRYDQFDRAMATAIGDLLFMLKNLDTLNVEKFDRQLETGSVILMGHSFGGNVAHALGFQEPRVRGIVDIDSKITERKIYGRVGVPPNTNGKPVLFIRGTLQYQDDVGDQLIRTKNADVKNYPVQHSAFVDIAFLSRQIPQLKDQNHLSQLWNWLFKSGPFFEVVDVDIGEQSIEDWFNLFRSQTILWMNQHLNLGRKI